jgi:hypothetical protein
MSDFCILHVPSSANQVSTSQFKFLSCRIYVLPLLLPKRLFPCPRFASINYIYRIYRAIEVGPPIISNTGFFLPRVYRDVPLSRLSSHLRSNFLIISRFQSSCGFSRLSKNTSRDDSRPAPGYQARNLGVAAGRAALRFLYRGALIEIPDTNVRRCPPTETLNGSKQL